MIRTEDRLTLARRLAQSVIERAEWQRERIDPSCHDKRPPQLPPSPDTRNYQIHPDQLDRAVVKAMRAACEPDPRSPADFESLADLIDRGMDLYRTSVPSTGGLDAKEALAEDILGLIGEIETYIGADD